MEQETFQVGILGPCEMRVGQTAVSLGSHKQRAVLAMLVIHRNRVVGIDELISAVWGESPHPGARAALHTYVSNLRGLMAADGINTRSALARTPPGYRMSLSDSNCDVGRFSNARTEGISALAAGHFEEASLHLSGALSHWRGRVLDDLREFTRFEPFVTALHEEKLMAQIARAEAEIACGRSNMLIAELEALVSEHPYREELWLRLITAYYTAQRQADALDAYLRLKRSLDEDLGIDPDPMLQALYGQMLRQEPLDAAKAAQLRADATLKAVGTSPVVAADNPCGPVLRDARGGVHRLRALCTRLGRSPDNNIVLTDAKVSRHHVAIVETPTGFVVADLNSTNGVYVSNRRIHPSATLANGDVIRLGDCEFTFELAASDVVPDDEAAGPPSQSATLC